MADHRSCSNWTGPSMTCVTSGRTPMENGFWPWTSDPEVRGYPEPGYGLDTLPGRFTAEGWATTLVTANGVFSLDLYTSAGFQKEVRVDWQPAPQVTDAAMEALDELQAAGRPWYLHVHYIDPHGTYCAPEELIAQESAGLPDVGLSRSEWCDDSYGAPDAVYWSGDAEERAVLVAWLEAQYRAELRYWDTEFGRLWGELERRGALEDTLVGFVTDHGQQFYERGGHGHGLYLGAEENRSTAWFWARNLAPATVQQTTFHPDVPATLYPLFGVRPTIPQTGHPVGDAPRDRAIHAINAWDPYSIQLLVARDDFELVYDWSSGGRAFHRLDRDPTGLTDSYAPRDPDVEAMEEELETWIDTVRTEWPHLPPPG